MISPLLKGNAARIIFALSMGLAHDAQPITRQSPKQFVAPPEQANLRRTVNGIIDAQLAGLSALRPGASEQDVWNVIGSTYRRLGVLGLYSVWGKFPPAGRLDAGDLLQVRTNVTQPLSAGISRTYPVSGRFTAEQRDIYLLVSEAEQAGARAARAGARRSEIEKGMIAVIKSGLLRLGLITDAASDEYDRWYWEGHVDRLGDGGALTDKDIDNILAGDIDLDTDWVLEPGMALEIGVGISTWERDGVARLPKNQVLMRKVRPAYNKYKNIRVMLSDSFLLTAAGLEHLSSQAPWRAEEVERALERR
jgi:Xaa-Pro aminopeptidase